MSSLNSANYCNKEDQRESEGLNMCLKNFWYLVFWYYTHANGSHQTRTYRKLMLGHIIAYGNWSKRFWLPYLYRVVKFVYNVPPRACCEFFACWIARRSPLLSHWYFSSKLIVHKITCCNYICLSYIWQSTLNCRNKLLRQQDMPPEKVLLNLKKFLHKGRIEKYCSAVFWKLEILKTILISLST